MALEEFEKELTGLINRHSLENYCNLPDFIIAAFLAGCFQALVALGNRNAEWQARSEGGG